MQAKSFREKHDEIRKQEEVKFKEIKTNFTNHYENIKVQMTKDSASMCDENGVNEITKENNMLEEKYEELLKEIEEKTELMTKEIGSKEEGTQKI